MAEEICLRVYLILRLWFEMDTKNRYNFLEDWLKKMEGNFWFLWANLSKVNRACNTR